MGGSQKEGGNFLNLLQKDGFSHRKGGGWGEGGGSNPGGNYVLNPLKFA